MKKNRIVFLVGLCVPLFLSTGCGVNYSGTYIGTQSTTLSGQAAISGPVTITINQQGNNGSVTGTLSSASVSGSFTGSPSGNTIGNVTATTSMTSSYGQVGGVNGVNGVNGMNNYPNAMVGGMNCGTMSWIGTLSLNNNTLSGQLTSSGTGMGLTTQPYAAGMNPMCTGSMNITATKQ